MKRKIIKKRKISKLGKSLVLKLTLVFVSLVSLLYVLFFVDPESLVQYYYAPFYLSLGFSIFFILNIFFQKLVVKLLIPLGILAILVLRAFGVKDNVNAFLIIGLTITLIYFFTVDSSNGKLKSN
jgi:hypothetical protein